MYERYVLIIFYCPNTTNEQCRKNLGKRLKKWLKWLQIVSLIYIHERKSILITKMFFACQEGKN